MKKILFILKERHYGPKPSYGLINSASHVAEFLEHERFNCKVVTVVDSNSIDKEVSLFKPDVVILEALWCPTYKLKELIEIKRHKHIDWVVRIHSDIGFLSCETQALQLVNEYIGLHKHNLTIALNSYKFVKSLSEVMNHNFAYLPNIITLQQPGQDFREDKQHIDIGCFGAMRLLKNQCFQAICAMKAADQLGKTLKFHITPVVDERDPISTNLIELFKNNRHELIIHDWLPNDEFQDLVKQMDIGLQVSYTESFNIVSADFINNNRLIVVSDAIDWLSPIMRTSSTDYDTATNKIIYMYKHRNSEWLKDISRHDLKEFNHVAKHEWLEFLNAEHNEHGFTEHHMGGRNPFRRR